MNRNTLLYKAYDLYADGFRQMTLGKVLWTVIIVKLLIIFVVLKIFFFPDTAKRMSKDGDKASYVASELTSR